jgi:5-methylcytosine-specific restriction endonuclease McrA
MTIYRCPYCAVDAGGFRSLWAHIVKRHRLSYEFDLVMAEAGDRFIVKRLTKQTSEAKMSSPPVVPTQSMKTPAHAPSPPKKPTGVNRAFYVMHRGDALRAQKHTCFYCYCPLTVRLATADHRIAQAKGGKHSRDNLAAACADCNGLKGTMSEVEFKRLIKVPPEGASLPLLLAWSRRRTWLATHRATRRLSRLFGISYDGPSIGRN